MVRDICKRKSLNSIFLYVTSLEKDLQTEQYTRPLVSHENQHSRSNNLLVVSFEDAELKSGSHFHMLDRRTTENACLLKTVLKHIQK